MWKVTMLLSLPAFKPYWARLALVSVNSEAFLLMTVKLLCSWREPAAYLLRGKGLVAAAV